MITSIFDRTGVPMLNKAMDAYSLRHEVISENIANIGTPEYKSLKVSFEDQLSDSMGLTSIVGVRTNENHLPIGKATTENVMGKVEERNTTRPFASGTNDVDIDLEMADLAKNQINYKFSARMVADIFKGLQSSIKGTL